jgi:hypothetical protein
MRRVVLLTVAGTLTVVGCGDQQIKQADYNVFFYYRSHNYPTRASSGTSERFEPMSEHGSRNYAIDQNFAEADGGTFVA